MADSTVDTTDMPRLRVDLLLPRVDIQPGAPAEVTLEVQNDSDVIETVRIQAVGIRPQTFVATPSQMSLFPGESGRLTLALAFPEDLAAGTHRVTLVATGVSGQVVPGRTILEVVVPEHRSVSVQTEPPVRTGGRRTRYETAVVNRGNAPIAVQLRASDADKRLKLDVRPSTMTLEPGDHVTVELRARGRPPWTGSPLEHAITLLAEGQDIEETNQVTFRQRARITAGLITVLTLSLIVILWALAMLFGVTTALAPSPAVKEIPGTFAAGMGVGVDDLDPGAVGGGISGTVVAASTSAGVARVTVEAIDGDGDVAGATATDDDGLYELAALLPTRYRLRFRAVGFDEVWFPDAPSAAGATLLSVIPDTQVEGTDARIVGRPGSLGGQAIAGDGGQQPISVEVAPLDVLSDTSTRTTTTDGSGVWSIGGLPAPGTYRVTYRSEGYTAVDVTEPVTAGQQSVVNTVRLPAASGTAGGVVADGDGTPIGGVEIEARRGDEILTTTTPTSGAIGTFTFVDLVTPATYLFTFRAVGFADETRAVRLGPGASVADLDVRLRDATGQATGVVSDTDGGPLGGVTVTVTGGDTTVVTESFTSGEVGRYRLADLPVPGTYAVTFEAAGFRSETLQITLTSEAPTATANTALTPSLGHIQGRVIDSDSNEELGAVTIEVSNSQSSFLTTTASEPASQRGRFLAGSLPAGSYTITATTGDGRTRTLLRSIEPGTTIDVLIDFGAQR